MMSERVPGVVHIVEDHESMRSALARLLRAFGYDVVEYSSAMEFQGRARSPSAECAVVDVQLPGLTGLELQQALAAAHDPTPVVFLTGHGNISMSVQAMKLGAVDFLTKPPDQGALLKAVGRALALSSGERVNRTRLKELYERYATLSSREREVFARVVTGMLNKQIAFELGTAERTIKAHRKRVMEKMQAKSVADLVRMADALNISLTPDSSLRPPQ